jgi:hypothetical protein
LFLNTSFFLYIKGAIPIVTLNTKRQPPNESVLEDSWHHRMVRGADGRNIYLTDPVQSISEPVLLQRISCSSVQVVDTVEIMFRWKHDTDLNELIHQEDPAWTSLNVLGTSYFKPKKIFFLVSVSFL